MNTILNHSIFASETSTLVRELGGNCSAKTFVMLSCIEKKEENRRKKEGFEKL